MWIRIEKFQNLHLMCIYLYFKNCKIEKNKTKHVCYSLMNYCSFLNVKNLAHEWHDCPISIQIWNIWI